MKNLNFYQPYGETEKIGPYCNYYKTIYVINDFKDFVLRGDFLNCCGVDQDKKISKEKAFSEAIERFYMNLVSHTSNISVALSGNDFFTKYSSQNYFDNDKYETHLIEVNKIKQIDINAASIITRVSFLPEQWVNFNNKHKKNNTLYTPISSNGFSSHLSLNSSIEQGILECFERDIVLSFFADMNQTSLIVNQENFIFSKEMKDFFSYLLEKNWKTIIFFLPNKHNIFCFLIWSFNEKEGKYLLGAGANFTLNAALESSFKEFISNFGLDLKVLKTNEKIINVNTYFEERAGKSLEWQPSNTEISNINDLIQKYNIFYKDFTNAKLKNRFNRHVTRVIIPELIYYSQEYTQYLKNIKKINPLIEKYGVFSPYNL